MPTPSERVHKWSGASAKPTNKRRKLGPNTLLYEIRARNSTASATACTCSLPAHTHTKLQTNTRRHKASCEGKVLDHRCMCQPCAVLIFSVSCRCQWMRSAEYQAQRHLYAKQRDTQDRAKRSREQRAREQRAEGREQRPEQRPDQIRRHPAIRPLGPQHEAPDTCAKFTADSRRPHTSRAAPKWPEH